MRSYILLSIVVVALQTQNSHVATRCDPANLAVVCGLENAEDLVRLPGASWIVASHVNRSLIHEQLRGFGPVEAVNMDTHEVRRLYPTAESAVEWDRNTYPDCPLPPGSISSYGLNVKPLGQSKFRLYVANHGNRQSVEVIDIAIRGEQLLTTWRGCIRSPKRIFPNGVAPLPGGGVVLSGFGVATWMPGRGWSEVSKITGSNGVEVSRDGRWLFVADDTTKAIIRMPVKEAQKEKVVKLDFVPDNLRWGEDGCLYVAGAYWPEGFPIDECFKSPDCAIGSKVVQLDSDSLTVKEVFHSDGIEGLFCATTALQIGTKLWIGCNRGDRLVVVGFKP